MLGLATTLTVAGLLGWFLLLGWTATYKADVPDRPEWKIVERFESSGASYYQSLVWWRGSAGPLGSPIDNRKRFNSSRWKRADKVSHTFSMGGPDGVAYMIEWGWPFRCLWGASESRGWASSGETTYGLYTYEWNIGANTKSGRDIPFAPIPLGLTLDTLTFGSLWWLALFGMGRFRRWNRLRRNHCPKCNYNLRGLMPDAPCPECGQNNTPSIPNPNPA